MDNTNTNQIIKKKCKAKKSKNLPKSDDTGHSPQKRQQQQQQQPNEENVMMKIKQIPKKTIENEITNLQELQRKKQNDQQNPEETIKNIEAKQNSRKNNKNKQKTETPQRKQKLSENNIENAGTTLQSSQQKLNITDIQIIESNTDCSIKNSYSGKNKIKENSLNNTIIADKDTFLQENVCQQLDHDMQYYHKKSYIFMENLKRDYKRLALIYNACLRSEQEREKRNKEEINRLKKKYQQLQVERTEIKRKRWCRYCESEAGYLSSIDNNFYCSPECEEKQNDLVNIMQDVFET